MWCNVCWVALLLVALRWCLNLVILFSISYPPSLIYQYCNLGAGFTGSFYIFHFFLFSFSFFFLRCLTGGRSAISIGFPKQFYAMKEEAYTPKLYLQFCDWVPVVLLPDPDDGPMKPWWGPNKVSVGSIVLKMRCSNLKICLRILKTKTILKRLKRLF
jgi:hypothetical protein